MGARRSGVFVGRDRELGVLRDALDAARAGRGATVLIAGEAGIGKTTLVAECTGHARGLGFELVRGRSIDFVGGQLPYQPFVDALRPLGNPWPVDATTPGSQLGVFEHTLTLLTERALTTPMVLVLEDLHWADVSSLDLVVFLAHNIGDRPVLLLGTIRDDERASAERMQRLADGVLRSGSALVLELGPLRHDELTTLLAARARSSLPPAVANMIAARSGGNPFFAEELVAVAGDSGSELPRGVRDLLLQRVARLDQATVDVVRVVAAAGRAVAYPLIHSVVELPEPALRDALRQAVDHRVLVVERSTSSFRFRHALLADAIDQTILPGEREELHARLAVDLSREGASPAELAPHWAAAGRSVEALVASAEAARQAEAVFGLAEALTHVERAIALWAAVPNADELVRADLPELCSWAAELASQTGAAPRAVELARMAIDLVEERDPLRAAHICGRLGRYLHESGRTDAALTACERMSELVPADPRSAARAEALSALGEALMMCWRFDESRQLCEQALALARSVGAQEVEERALRDLGRDLAYVGDADGGLGYLWRALELAEQRADPDALRDAYVSLTDVLLMLGRPVESARVGRRGLDAVRRYGLDSTVLVANLLEALLAIGEWDEADHMSAAALRAITANFPYMLLMLRADLELGRGQFEAARAHLDAALATLREDRGQGIYDVYVAELALWEHRWTEADEAVRDGLARATSPQAAQLRVWFCAKGLRAHAELAALARARRDTDAVHAWLARAAALIAAARRASEEAAAVTPNARGWLALAEAEYERAQGIARPGAWSNAAASWERLERTPLAAYCRWRQAETLVAVGAPRTEASVSLRQAREVADRIGASPLLRELELLAQRARLDLAPPRQPLPDGQRGARTTLGLTAREEEVLSLVARGYTNREIASTLFISVKTASVHVSNILRKLDAPSRRDAAAIVHRLHPPPGAPADNASHG